MDIKSFILNSKDTTTASVDVPEWGTPVSVRSWSALERAKFQAWFDSGDKSELMSRVCVLSISDENGNRVFSDDEVNALNSKNAKALDRIALFALEHNAITPKAVDDAKKN